MWSNGPRVAHGLGQYTIPCMKFHRSRFSQPRDITDKTRHFVLCHVATAEASAVGKRNGVYVSAWCTSIGAHTITVRHEFLLHVGVHTQLSNEGSQMPAQSPPLVLLDVGGMKCGGCSAAVKRMLAARPDVESAAVNLITETAAIRFRLANDIIGTWILHPSYLPFPHVL